ncbi:GldG family protein [Novosphingobium sp. 9U]|uniref:GldG family protein n=1 Tax=Novosphingobium sp. 9U TaxID=2653158 RepID=UPI0012EFBCB3|nr:GldG family protein [Novosphingobium sp. 9U]VWX46559.1 conserved hypothetical protein [Novosphingobium sp. 9U]
MRGQLADVGPQHWAARTLAEQGKVVPVDTLAGEQGLPLPSSALLVLVQPRPLTPDENFALDTWVRGGGHVLLFADPMLTAASDYPLGDPRRPQDIAMLSPILSHWGLALAFDEAQPRGEQSVEARGIRLPVNLRGQLGVSAGAHCRVGKEQLLADCRIGKGRAIVVGDAALFDGEDAGRITALEALIALAISR